MKKWSIVFVVGLAVLALLATVPAYAQGPADGGGLLHDYMVEAFAEALGITADDLEARLASGETMAAIALDLGVSAEEFRTLWLEARQSALGAAVADGVITAEHAEWMLSRMQAGNRAMGAMRSAGAGLTAGTRGRGVGLGTAACPWAQP